MKELYCECGQTVFCENSRCNSCGRSLGFDPWQRAIISLQSSADGEYQDGRGNRFVFCANRHDYDVCNGVVPLTDGASEKNLCKSCGLNRTIPITNRRQNLVRWKRLEQAKRRMIAGLSVLGLDPSIAGADGPMRFDFLEDKRSHPNVHENFISTGHKDGVITINLLEADDIQRVQQRELMGERYRTVLGHFRHEAGHYFFPDLVAAGAGFADLFGDPTGDYDEALQAYYDNGPRVNWDQQFISAYASSHPLEDWAECFAHYLHIKDTLETARCRGLVSADAGGAPIGEQLPVWGTLTVGLNEVSRSLGLRDAYPFVLTPTVIAKLEFVEQAIAAAASR